MKRLETISPSLAEKLVLASTEQRRSLAIAACKLATQHAGLDSREVSAALASMQQRLSVTAEEVAKLTALVERLDERYFMLQEEAAEGRASPTDFMQVSMQSASAPTTQGASAQ